jgi:hypothetical protein
VLLIVVERDWLLPTVTLPKLRLIGLEPSVPTGTAVPVPERPIVSDEFDAFEVMVTVPLAPPVVVGANFTLRDVLCPAVKVNGTAIPLRVNPVPLMAAWEIVTLALPVLVSVAERDWLLPTVTLPNPRLVGLEPSVPTGTAVPVPEIGTVRVAFEAFDVIVMLPEALPVDVGANFAAIDVLCPAAKVSGAEIPLNVKPVPLIAA